MNLFSKNHLENILGYYDYKDSSTILFRPTSGVEPNMVFIHEATHANLCGSTSYGILAKTFIPILSRLLEKSDDEKFKAICQGTIQSIVKNMWITQEGCATTIQIIHSFVKCVSETHSLQSASEQANLFYNSLPEEYQHAVTLFSEFSNKSIIFDRHNDLIIKPWFIQSLGEYCLNPKIYDWSFKKYTDDPVGFLELISTREISPDSRLIQILQAMQNIGWEKVGSICQDIVERNLKKHGLGADAAGVMKIVEMRGSEAWDIDTEINHDFQTYLWGLGAFNLNLDCVQISTIVEDRANFEKSHYASLNLTVKSTGDPYIAPFAMRSNGKIVYYPNVKVDVDVLASKQNICLVVAADSDLSIPASHILIRQKQALEEETSSFGFMPQGNYKLQRITAEKSNSDGFKWLATKFIDDDPKLDRAAYYVVISDQSEVKTKSIINSFSGLDGKLIVRFYQWDTPRKTAENFEINKDIIFQNENTVITKFGIEFVPILNPQDNEIILVYGIVGLFDSVDSLLNLNECQDKLFYENHLESIDHAVNNFLEFGF